MQKSGGYRRSATLGRIPKPLTEGQTHTNPTMTQMMQTMSSLFDLPTAMESKLRQLMCTKTAVGKSSGGSDPFAAAAWSSYKDGNCRILYYNVV